MRVRSLGDRVKNILLHPNLEWMRIDGEPASVSSLFRGYAAILAAISPVCHLVGSLVFGYGAFGIVYRPPVISAVVGAIVSYALGLASIFVLGLIIDALAPNFGGMRNKVQAMKVAVYASTASWVAGVFALFPPLMLLAILGGLYSLYLLYAGLPRLMKTSQDKALPYTAVVIVIAVVLFIVVGAVVGSLGALGLGMGGVGRLGAGGVATGQLAVPGGSIDVARLQAASAQLQAQAASVQASAAAAQAGAAPSAGATAATGIAPDVLKGLLPATVAGYGRGDISAESGSAAGIGAASAKADYTKGAAHMTLEVTDMGAMGALGGLAGALNVNSSKETATGYEKVSTVAGRMTTEEYDRASRHGKYGVMAAGHVMVEAEGDDVSMDDLKSRRRRSRPRASGGTLPASLNPARAAW